MLLFGASLLRIYANEGGSVADIVNPRSSVLIRGQKFHREEREGSARVTGCFTNPQGSPADEILDELLARVGENAFGVELHAFDRMLAMP